MRRMAISRRLNRSSTFLMMTVTNDFSVVSIICKQAVPDAANRAPRPLTYLFISAFS